MRCDPGPVNSLAEFNVSLTHLKEEAMDFDG